MSAKNTALKLGLRESWAKYAVWPEDGITRFCHTYPSIRFGRCLNEVIQIATSNKLFYRDGETYTIAEEDLDRFEVQTRTPVPRSEPYHCMAHTKIETFLAPSMQVDPKRFLDAYDDYAQGLHQDLLDVIEHDEMEIYAIPLHVQQADAKDAIKRSFDLFRLLNVWRKRLLSDQVMTYEMSEQQSYRYIFGTTGHQVEDGGTILSCVFFGQRFIDGGAGSRKSWIVFIPIELFEQLVLSWLDAKTGPVMLFHLDHCGLIIPHLP